VVKEEDQVTTIVIQEDRKCTRLPVKNAVKTARFLLDPMAADQYTVVLVLRLEVEEALIDLSLEIMAEITHEVLEEIAIPQTEVTEMKDRRQDKLTILEILQL
jgi:hypothetical protein